MFSKQLKLSMVTFLLIAFSISSVSVLFSKEDDSGDEIVGYRCDNYLTETYTDAGKVIEKGCGDISQAQCDNTTLTLTITESTGCNTKAQPYDTCEETKVVKDSGSVQCGWVMGACRDTSYTEKGKTKNDCVDSYLDAN